MLEAGVGEFSALLQSSEVVSVRVGWGVQRLRSSSILPPSAYEMVGHGPPLFELWFSYLKSEELDALLPPYFSSVQVLSIVTRTKKKKAASAHGGNLLGGHWTVIRKSKAELSRTPQQWQAVELPSVELSMQFSSTQPQIFESDKDKQTTDALSRF